MMFEDCRLKGLTLIGVFESANFRRRIEQKEDAVFLDLQLFFFDSQLGKVGARSRNAKKGVPTANAKNHGRPHETRGHPKEQGDSSSKSHNHHHSIEIGRVRLAPD